VEEGVRGVIGEVSVGLAILGVLGSLGVGAAVGAVATHLLRERADKQRNAKEAQALTTLVREEIVINSGELHDLSEDPNNLWSHGRPPAFKVKTWEDARVRLAQLMPKEDLTPVMNYYINLQGLLEDLENVPNMRRDKENEDFVKAVIAAKRDHLTRLQGEAVSQLEKYGA
jgi:hypothetical protein